MAAIWLVCSCCGAGIRDTKRENVSHGMIPYPHDLGFGMCRECGGDDEAEGDDDAAVRRRLGWAGEMFYDARIEIVQEKLSAPNAEKFRAMPLRRKIAFVNKAIGRGLMF